MPNRKNWFQARHETDSGKTHDKVNHPDPAAAPLGTDEEAGGAHTSPDAIAESLRRRKSTDGETRASSNTQQKRPD